MLEPNQVKRILFIRFSSIGDIVLLTPLFRETKKIFPNAKIDFLTSKEFSGICENNPNIDRQILLDRKNPSMAEFTRVSEVCRKSKNDLIFDAHRSLRSRLLLLSWFGFSAFWSKKIKKVDKRSFKRNMLLLFKWNLFQSGILSQREAYLQMLDEWKSIENMETHSELFPPEETVKKVDQLQIQKRLDLEKVVCVGPSASFPGKCWPKESFKELCERLVQEGFQVVLVGGAGESETKWIVENSNEVGDRAPTLLDLSGKLTFLESAELLKRARLAISNDSAIMHFAEAVGTPVVTIFGPTVREFGYGPFLNNSKLLEVDLPCRPCSRYGKRKCHNQIKYECLKLISVQRVFDSALRAEQIADC